MEIEPSAAVHVDQPDRVRARPARRLADGRVQHGAAPGLGGPRLAAHGDGHDRAGHPQQRADRRAGGSVTVRGGIGRRQRRGTPGQGEVMQRGQDDRGMPLARRRRLDGAQRLAGLTQRDRDPLIQRRCSGRSAVPAARKTSPGVAAAGSGLARAVRPAGRFIVSSPVTRLRRAGPAGHRLQDYPRLPQRVSLAAATVLPCEIGTNNMCFRCDIGIYPPQMGMSLYRAPPGWYVRIARKERT